MSTARRALRYAAGPGAVERSSAIIIRRRPRSRPSATAIAGSSRPARSPWRIACESSASREQLGSARPRGRAGGLNRVPAGDVLGRGGRGTVQGLRIVGSQNAEHVRDGSPDLEWRDDRVDQPGPQCGLGAVRSGESPTGEGLDQAGAGEADPRSGLGDRDVRKGADAGERAPRRGIGEHGDVGLSRGLEGNASGRNAVPSVRASASPPACAIRRSRGAGRRAPAAPWRARAPGPLVRPRHRPTEPPKNEKSKAASSTAIPPMRAGPARTDSSASERSTGASHRIEVSGEAEWIGGREVVGHWLERAFVDQMLNRLQSAFPSQVS